MQSTAFSIRPKVKKSPAKKESVPPKVIILSGPTAVGKTALSLFLSETLTKAEIISADSMQVYRGMDIGTAKPSWKERFKVPHHLIDSREIYEPFNVVDFFYECRSQIQDILKRGKTPLIIGGAGFYLRSLLSGPPSGPPSVPLLRDKLEQECDILGIDNLFNRLASLDPEYASTISSGDKQKIIRGLEIIALTKKPVSAFKSPKLAPYDFRCWFLHRERDSLYKRIEDRCMQMIQSGLIDEVKRLKEQGLLLNKSAMQSIGYRQTLTYLETQQTPRDFYEYKEEFKKCSRHLAKRQFTWFRKEPDFRWLDLDLYDLESAASLILKDYL